MSLDVINPFKNEKIRSFPEMSQMEVNAIIKDVHQEWLEWASFSVEQRSICMLNAANILKKDKQKYARLMVEEMGKVYSQGISEIDKCAWVCEYYAENAKIFLKDELIDTDATKSFVSFQPLGVVLAIMPWNFPFWQVFRFAAPGLMAGNAAILKHASNVPGCALAIEEVFMKAGFPKNIFRSLLIGSDMVEKVIEHPKVKAVTLTGSTGAGKSVATIAGQFLKKCVLELGGSDPYIILEDADIPVAVQACVAGRLINSGQSCIAAKRFIVVDAIKEKFEEAFVELMMSKKMGDPMEDIDIGPMARIDLRDELHRQVEESIAKGAERILGGEIPNQEGAWYPATILKNVKPGMPAYDDEMFGPVASIINVKDEDEAITVANDTLFGLGAAVFTQDLKKGEEIAKYKLNAGCCFVNSYVKSDPRLPFGGINESGYGRELSHYGIKEFVNVKTISIEG